MKAVRTTLILLLTFALSLPVFAVEAAERTELPTPPVPTLQAMHTRRLPRSPMHLGAMTATTKAARVPLTREDTTKTARLATTIGIGNMGHLSRLKSLSASRSFILSQ